MENNNKNNCNNRKTLNKSNINDKFILKPQLDLNFEKCKNQNVLDILRHKRTVNNTSISGSLDVDNKIEFSQQMSQNLSQRNYSLSNKAVFSNVNDSNNVEDQRNRELATSLIVEENLSLLNQKLKIASEYYNYKNDINLAEQTIERNKSKNVSGNKNLQLSETAKFHISSYIKRFLKQTHENTENRTEDVFNLKNCKVHSITGNLIYMFYS